MRLHNVTVLIGMFAAVGAPRPAMAAGYVQIVDVHAEPGVIRLSGEQTCTSVTVHVSITPDGGPPPTITLWLGQWSGMPRLSTEPEQQPAHIDFRAQRGDATFRVCAAKGSVSGPATLQAVIASVGPGRSYAIHTAEPEEKGRVTVSVRE